MVQTRTWEERFERLHGLVECIDARGKSRFAGRGRLVVVRVADAFAHFSFSSRTKVMPSCNLDHHFLHPKVWMRLCDFVLIVSGQY